MYSPLVKFNLGLFFVEAYFTLEIKKMLFELNVVFFCSYLYETDKCLHLSCSLMVYSKIK